MALDPQDDGVYLPPIPGTGGPHRFAPSPGPAEADAELARPDMNRPPFTPIPSTPQHRVEAQRQQDRGIKGRDLLAQALNMLNVLDLDRTTLDYDHVTDRVQVHLDVTDAHLLAARLATLAARPVVEVVPTDPADGRYAAIAEAILNRPEEVWCRHPVVETTGGERVSCTNPDCRASGPAWAQPFAPQKFHRPPDTWAEVRGRNEELAAERLVQSLDSPTATVQEAEAVRRTAKAEKEAEAEEAFDRERDRLPYAPSPRPMPGVRDWEDAHRRFRQTYGYRANSTNDRDRDVLRAYAYEAMTGPGWPAPADPGPPPGGLAHRTDPRAPHRQRCTWADPAAPGRCVLTDGHAGGHLPETDGTGRSAGW